MTPDGKQPTKNKLYYDIFTWLVTQLAFTFLTAPFIILSVHDSMMAWARVYFYGIIGVAACSAFLMSPGKKWLQQKVKARTMVRPEPHRADSHEGMQGATLGVPHEPGQEFDEMVDEIVEEVKKRRGSKTVPDAMELRKMVADNLSENLNGDKSKTQ